MPRGYNASGDILTQLGDGTDVTQLWTDLQDAMTVWNDRRDNLRGMLAFNTINHADAVLQAWTAGELEPASEYGEPVSIRPEAEHILLGFRFGWYDLAAKFTWQFLADASSEQVDSVASAAMEADNRTTFNAVMGALLNNSTRVNKENDVVYPLWAGQPGDLPPEHDGEVFADSHNHYVTTGGATPVLTQASVDALMNLVLEHGYGADERGQLLLIAHRNEADVIRGFRSTAAGGTGKFDFISNDSAPPFLTDENLVGAKPPVTFGSVPLIGQYGQAFVAENSLMPRGYVVAAASGGPNNAANPVGFRQHPTTGLQGFRLIKGRTPDYPLIDSFYNRGFGTGVRHRGAAAVLQVSTSATYEPPAQFAGATA